MLLSTVEHFTHYLGGTLWVGYARNIARSYFGCSGVGAFVQMQLLDSDTIDLSGGSIPGTGVQGAPDGSVKIPQSWRDQAFTRHRTQLLAVTAFLEAEGLGHLARVDLRHHPGLVHKLDEHLSVVEPVDGYVDRVAVHAENAVLVRDHRVWIPAMEILRGRDEALRSAIGAARQQSP